MKKLFYILIILIFSIAPAFADSSFSTKVEFSLKFYPENLKVNFNPNYYIYYLYSENNISAYLDIRDSGWKGGYLKISNIRNILNITLAKYYLDVYGSKALLETLWYNRNNLNGIQIVLNIPLKVTATYLFRNIESDVSYNTGRFRIKGEGNISFLNFWGLYDMDLLQDINTYVLGAEIAPFSFLSIFFEYGNTQAQWSFGGTLKLLDKISLSGYYKGDKNYYIEANLKNLIPNINLYGVYNSNNYMYIQGIISSLPLGLGSFDALYGYYTTYKTFDIWYGRLSSKFGKVSNTFRIYKGWSFGTSWFDTSVPITFENIISLSF